ncbi:amidohydrolase family protein [Candidatus Omnitrophota bacterium]
MIIDTHVHYGVVWENKYGTDPSEFLVIMDNNGVDKALLMGHRGLLKSSDNKRCNDTIKETCENSGGRLIPLALVHPDYGDACLRELERCINDLDMRGLKLHPWRQGFSTSSQGMSDLAVLCGVLGVPVIYHDGTPCYSMPCQIGGLAMRFPKTNFVLGHAGLLELWRSAMSFARRCDNLYITLCGPHFAGLQAIVDTVDDHRILWGTDYGPGFKDPVRYRKGLVDNLDMTDAVREKIMSGNAVDLFRL